MPQLGTAYVVIRASLAPLRAGLNLAKAAVTKAMGTITAIIRKMGRMIKRVFQAVIVAILGSVYAFGKFEEAMRRATAVSDTTEQQFNKMSEMARETAIRLNIGAHDAAEAFYFLGSAGLSVSDQIKAFTPVATLAKAAVIDMGSAAEMVVDTMKGFQIGFENTTHVTDVLAKTVTSSNTTFAQLGQAMSMVSGVAKMTNNTLEETSTLLAVMADVGIKGSRAGMTLRRSLLNLAAPMSDLRKLMADYSIEVYDANGKMKSMLQLVGEISEKLKGATEAQRNMAFKTLFGARAIAGQIAVFNKGKDALEAFRKALQEAGGTAAEIAAKQLNALGQQFGILRKIWRDTAITIGSYLAPALRLLIDYSKEMAEKIGGYLKKHEAAVKGWALRIAQIFIDLSEYLKTDWREAIKGALEATIPLFEAFTKIIKNMFARLWQEITTAFGLKVAEMYLAAMETKKGWLKWMGLKAFAPDAIKIMEGAMAGLGKGGVKKLDYGKIMSDAVKEGLSKLPPALKDIFKNLAPILEAATGTAAGAGGAGGGGIQLGSGIGGVGGAGQKLGFVGLKELWQKMAIGLGAKKDKTMDDIANNTKRTADELEIANRHLADADEWGAVGA